MQRAPYEALDVGQRTLLERIATGTPLADMLESIVRLIEQQADDMMCSILLVDHERGCIHPGAAPSLPAAYTRALDGLPIGPEAGSCGAAAWRAERVIVTDIATHPYWRIYKGLALAHGLRACWSSPILATTREVLGTFAMYYRTARAPSDAEIEWVDVATHLASIAIMRDRSERALREREERLRLLHANVTDVIFFLAVEAGGVFRFLSVNPSFVRATGLAESAVVGKTIDDVIPEPSRSLVREKYAEAMRLVRTVSWDEVTTYPSGSKHGEVTITPIVDETGTCTHLIGTVHDVTARTQAEEERRRLTAQLHQAQRLQALGTLAGGIAHDFNNILSAIIVNTELAFEHARAARLETQTLEEIRVASERATALVRQILGFSQNQESERELIALQPIIEEAARLLRAGLPSSLAIVTRLAATTPPIYGDPTQVYQIVMNLGTNARRAMERRSGAIEIALDAVTLTPQSSTRPVGLADGVYACIHVTDGGHGMDPPTLARIFEPFFTTKPVGQGAGLGLSVVHGIVGQHGGAIDVQSRPGHGTAFHVWLPAASSVILTDHRPGGAIGTSRASGC
jgi:PAS domain S-box-containing protein